MADPWSVTVSRAGPNLPGPYTTDRWWVLALPLALTAAATAAAYVLAVVRDHGSQACRPTRPGRPAAAAAWLSAVHHWPLGLAWRLQRGTLYGWALGFAFTFAASGAAAKGIGSLLGGSAQLRNAFTRLGGEAGITDAYLAAIMSLAGLAAAAYATSAVLRLRTEETGGQAEPLLATATSRIRWGLSHIAVAVVGTAVLLAVAGVAAGLGYGLRTGSAGPEVARLLGAAMVQLPASLAVAGAAVVLFGLAPRASVAGAWTVVGVMVLIALFGQVLRLSQWVLDVSPFTHVPKLPGASLTMHHHRRAAAVAEPGRPGPGRRGPGRPAPPRHRLTRGGLRCSPDPGCSGWRPANALPTWRIRRGRWSGADADGRGHPFCSAASRCGAWPRTTRTRSNWPAGTKTGPSTTWSTSRSRSEPGRSSSPPTPGSGPVSRISAG